MVVVPVVLVVLDVPTRVVWLVLFVFIVVRVVPDLFTFVCTVVVGLVVRIVVGVVVLPVFTVVEPVRLVLVFVFVLVVLVVVVMVSDVLEGVVCPVREGVVVVVVLVFDSFTRTWASVRKSPALRIFREVAFGFTRRSKDLSGC